MSENPDDLFQDDSTIPESNWFKFDEIGKSIQGVLVMTPYDQEAKLSGMQRVFVIQKPDGTEYNVALKHTSNKRQIQQLRSAEVNDILAFKYTGDFDTGKGNPAKTIEVRLRKMSNLEKQISNIGL